MEVTLATITILIVDDQALVRTALRIMLGSLGAKKLIEAASGEDALTALREHDIDLILSDIDMTPQNGIELLQNIRCGSAGVRRDTLMIMLTGIATRDVVSTCVNLDVNAFLTKPPKKDLLGSRLQYALTTPFTLKAAHHYQKMPMPSLQITAAPSVPIHSSHTDRTADGVISANAVALTENDTRPIDPGFAYIVWQQGMGTGQAAIDKILIDAVRLINEVYDLRGKPQSLGNLEQLLRRCQHFLQDEVSLIYTHSSFVDDTFIVCQRERDEHLQGRFARLQLYLQVSPELLTHELFASLRLWWQNAVVNGWLTLPQLGSLADKGATK